MQEVTSDQLKQAVEDMHGGTATFVESVAVNELFMGKSDWQGVVHVFDLDGHHGATRAYAWSAPVEGNTQRRIFSVLHLGFIRSPQDAVKAATVVEHRS